MRELLKQVDDLFLEKYTYYMSLNPELAKYSNKSLNKDEIESLNKLLEKIYETYNEFHPLMDYCGKRHPEFVKIGADFNEFINNLKKSGAVEIKG